MFAKLSRPLAGPLHSFDRGLVDGALLTLLIALAGSALSHLPVLGRIGPLACALLIAVAWRHRFGFPAESARGIRFSSGTLLRFAIVLFGLKLDVADLLSQGWPLLLRAGATVAFALVATLVLGRLLKADRGLTLLLAIGTAICGAAAIAAAAPLLRSKDEDAAMGAGLIAVVGTLFATAYAIAQPWLPLDAGAYAVWSGLTLHEIAHVAMAAAPAGPDALADGLLAKLCRVALLVPLCLGISLAAKLRERRQPPAEGGIGHAPGRFPFPWFLLGFVAASLFGSYVLPSLLPEPGALLEDASFVTTLLLGMAMAGLGLNVNLRDFRSRAGRPLAAMLVASVLLGGLTYWSL